MSRNKFGLTKVRFRGLDKNTGHLLTLFALSNLWMARRLQYSGRQVVLTYELPLNEIVMDFFDRLKSVSRGSSCERLEREYD